MIRKDKLKAFAYHFLLSAIVMLMAAGIIFYLWYPNPFYKVFGVSTIFMLMLGIDLILGPLLTFIVYKKGKKTLKMDLAIIGLIQLLAFGWGMWNIAEARPAWIAIYKDTAYAVSPAYLKNPENELNVTAPSFLAQNWTKPKIVMLAPTDNQQNIIYHTEKYLPYDAQKANQQKLPLSKIEQTDKSLYQQIMSDYPNATGYFPVINEASTDLPLLLIDKQGQIIGQVLAINKLTVGKK